VTLNQFLSLGDTHSISSDEAESLNYSLSTVSIEDIPEQKRRRVLDYLVVALNMNSVDPRIKPNLDRLRLSIENSTAP